MSDNKSPRTIKEDFSIIKRAVKLIESNTPHYLLHTFSYGFFSVAKGIGSNYITATIIDELTGGRDMKKLSILLSLYTFEIIFSVFRDYSWRRFRVFHIISMEWTEVLLNNKNFTMDYNNCEDSAVRAKRQMITDSSGIGGLDDMVYGILMLFQGLIEIVLCSAITAQMFFKHSAAALTSFEKVIDSGFTTVGFLVFVAVCSYFEFRVMGKYSRQSVPIVKNNSYIERILHYYLDDYLDDSKASKDVRIFNQQRLIERKTGDIFKKWSVSLAEHYRLIRKKRNAFNLFYVLTTAATYLYVGLKTYIGSFGLGGFFKYQYSISRIVNSASQLSQNIANLRSNNEYLLLLFDYLDMPSDMHYGTIPTEKRSDNVYDIELHDVSFKYPGSDSYAIKNLSFKFKVGERVAAYARVSTDSDEQFTSFEAQVDYYTKYIAEHPEWTFVKVYSDEGISGTSTKHRAGFQLMIADALAGRIDLIVTKSISRFARNTIDTLTTVRKLKEKGVEVFFEKDYI